MKQAICTLLLIAAVAAMTVGGVAPATVCAADETITLTYANFPPAVTFPCVQMERWKEVIEKRTEGKVKVQTMPGSTLLGAKDMFDGVVNGVADIGCLAMSYQPGRFPVSEAVDLPLDFASAEAASLTLFDLLESRQPEEFKDVKILTAFTCPPSSFMTSKPVKSLADLEGMELRCSGTGVGVIEKLGGTPVAMPMSETPDAIQKGVVKGIVSSLEVLKDMNFAAYCPNATPANLYVVTFAVVMNKDSWDKLPPDVQKQIDHLRRRHARWTGRYVDQHVAEAIAWSKEKYDLQVHELSEADRKAIAEKVQPMIDAYIEKTTQAGLPGKETVEEVRALKAKHEKAIAAHAAKAASSKAPSEEKDTKAPKE